ncbi:hypothetical protein H8S20_01390 [Clostridium sp. NSJ-6]|uniref:Lipoprotein n=1 Tax=Clostridium hominis TaxID=2763036 RepID=A0ABR7D844_9CLOT|nr:hypothetical protein [Clostridium hominis]MBC5627540.1 hypothetical protein [Clostridium hominis]MDU2672599.1 hypothetical protein [Clostridium sp.]
MKKTIILSMIIITILQVGCSNKDTETINSNEIRTEENNKEDIVEENYTVFNSLGNVYEKNEDLTLREKGEEIFNSIIDIPYERGKFMEIDYANDFIEKYLSGDKSVYDYLIDIDDNYEIGYKKSTDDERNRLNESLQFLREQMYLGDEDPIYFKISKVSYEGQVDGIKDSIILNVGGYISADNINFLSLTKFTVTIVPEKDKLLINII